MSTERKEIIEILMGETCGAKDLSKRMGIREKAVYQHLYHIGRSVAAMGKKLKIQPAVCIGCGFSFGKRDRFTRPGRCPKCRSERISEPRFNIQ